MEMSPSHRTRLRTRAGIALAILGVLLALVSVVVFASQLSLSDQPAQGVWWVYFASLAAWIIGVLLWAGQGGEKSKPFSLLLIPILILAALLRLSELDTLPYGIWYDEALNALDTREIIEQPNNRPLSEHNTTFLHFALYAAGMSLTSLRDITGVRLVQALFGIGSVLMAYLVGRRLRGETFGLAFAFILAVMRWSINFSRIGMTGIEVTFWVLFAFYALHRLTKDAQFRDALLFGAALGFGLWFYRAFQLLLIPLLLYALLAWRWRAHERRLRGVLAIAAITVLIIAHPLGLAALLQPDLLFGRVNQISIFAQDLHGQPILDVMLQSTIKHLRMFHFMGDHNGRHNLPYAPMLDPLTGLLVVAGLGLAVMRLILRDGWREHLFFLLLTAFSIATGVLSIPSEAPQALRVIGVVPAVAYFAALAAEALLRFIQHTIEARSTPRLAWVVTAVAALALALPMFAYNYDVYFRQQRTHYDSFIMFSTPETAAARALHDMPAGEPVWFSSNISWGTQAMLLTPDRFSAARQVDLVAELPIPEVPTTDITLMMSADEALMVDAIGRLYPDAQIQLYRASDFGVQVSADQRDILFYVLIIPRDDIAAALNAPMQQGLLARYYENETWSGEPTIVRQELFVHRYIHIFPLTRPYTVEWLGSLYAPTSGQYTVQLRAITAAWLTIDDQSLLETRIANEPVSATMVLDAGWHTIRLRHLDAEIYSRIYLEWMPPDATDFTAITSEFLRPP